MGRNAAKLKLAAGARISGIRRNTAIETAAPPSACAASP